jgi:lysophospholipase L1-like esterase
MSLHSKASVKFSPLEMDMGEPEQSDRIEDDERDDGSDDGGEYFDDEYLYDDNGNGHRDAVPLVNSPRRTESGDGMALVDPERRAICWPVYLVAALLIGLLTAAVVLIPPADEESNTGSNHHYCPLVDDSSSNGASSTTNWTSAWDGYVEMVADFPDRCRHVDDHEHNTDTSSCKCLNPSEPSAPVPQRVQAWQHAFDLNLQRIANQTDKLDVILTGDGLVEHWWGVDTNMPVPTTNDTDDTSGSGSAGVLAIWEGNQAVYDSLFSLKHGASVNGLALGIAGDQSPNLLYRLQHGEMSMEDQWQPAVWWVVIGSVDYRVSDCLTDCVVAAQIRVVQEILQQQPKATVVINSLLPVAGAEDDSSVSDINDSLQCYAATTEGVEFFNATDLFLSLVSDDDIASSAGGRTVNTTLLPDGLHPGVEGSWVWGNAIVAKVEEILHRPNL